MSPIVIMSLLFQRSSAKHDQNRDTTAQTVDFAAQLSSVEAMLPESVKALQRCNAESLQGQYLK